MAGIREYGPTLDSRVVNPRCFDGSGPPADIPDAKVGDFYLDVNTGKLYKLNSE